MVLLNGAGTITFPNTTEVLNFTAGEIIVAVDTAEYSASGHRSLWLGGTLALQLPFEGGVWPQRNATEGKCTY